MHLSQRIVRFATLSLAGMLLAGCAMTASTPGSAERPYPPGRPPEIGDILHMPTGVFVTEEQMLAAVTDSRIVYVGETHDNPASHRLQLRVLAAMAERYPGDVSLGMEMFNTAQQPVLDRWSKGELDEKSFLKESDWHANWRMDFDYYRQLLVFARDHRIPVVGLNATRDMVEAVGKSPLEELPPEVRENLPEMDMTDPYQRTMSEAVFADHDPGANQLEGFLRVQTLWDETMAENIAKTLRQRGDEHRMVVLAGGNHVRHGFGIPRRMFRRLPASYTLVGNRELKVSAAKQAQLMDIEMPEFPMPPYDYLVHTEYESLLGNKVKLGVRMKAAEGRVVAEAIIAESAAALAGVEAGDVLLRLDGVKIEEMFDLVYEVSRRQEGDEAILEVERNGEILSLPVLFKPLPAMPHHR